MATDARWSDLAEKLAVLAELAAEFDLDRIVLREPANLTWLLGARVNVPQTLDTACLDVVVQANGEGPNGQGPNGEGRPLSLVVVTNAIEAPRLRDQELAGLGDVCNVEWEVVPWWEGRDARLPTGARVGSDRARSATTTVTAELARARRRLTGDQRSRLGEVCRDAAAAATATALAIGPGSTGFSAAGVLARELLERELDPVVLLVGGAAHLEAHRHPLPVGEAVGSRALLVACARRHGLIASVSRIVSFGPLGADERDAYDRLLRVEEVFLDQSVVGARLGDVVTAGCAAYATHGFASEEWHRHHQGGLSGFVPREFPAHAGSDDVLEEGAVVAWNPSAAGWKVEDTCLVLPGGPQPLVDDGTWPSLTVGGRRRPDVLVR